MQRNATLAAGENVFKVYNSNHVDVLQALLVELIQREPLQNPFEQEHILVQSPGMSQWLKMGMADSFGVAANIHFPLPATFIWEMFIQVLPDVPRRSAFNKEAMTWKLMEILPPLLKHPDFTSLYQYLEDDTDGAKRYQLCEKIADIFDGYLVYRPDWISAWEAEKPIPELQGEDNWQRILWQALYDHTMTLAQSPFHRANLYDEFIETLNHFQGPLPDSIPKRLFVFGITALPPRYMEALYALGQHIDVHLLFTNPCRYDWSEVKDRRYIARQMAKRRQRMERDAEGHFSMTLQPCQLSESLAMGSVGNSLLASMGKMGRDNLHYLTELGGPDIDIFVENKRQNLLQHIHQDILDLMEHQDDKQLENSYHKQVIQHQDDTLSFHACHSPLREVEVLHDQLLTLFQKQPDLKPRDIIVMVADINRYSPAIQAVFGNAPSTRFIPYSISDRSADKESPVINAYLQLLQLPASRCLASELLSLLEVPAVMERFELSQDEFTRAVHWVEETGIRWGLNQDTSADFDLPKTYQNTWESGIQRMLLGYAMGQDSGLFESKEGLLQPYNEVQGLDAALVGKLAQFITAIGESRERLKAPQTVQQWQTVLVDIMDDFFSVDTEGEGVLSTIRNTVAKLVDNVTEAHYQQPLASSIVCQYLKDKLSGTRVSQRFLAGQVNFCTLMPMRSIPFKVVCLLGMNDGQYPRTVPKDGFDLMNDRQRRGDRSRRDDDRYMFLEAILSAQSHLYISYVGQSLQDNSKKVPSVLVTELMEYCQQNYCLDGDQDKSPDDSGQALVHHLSAQHTMTPFSPGAFQGEHKSYASEWLPVVNQNLVDTPPFSQHPLPCYKDTLTFPYALAHGELLRFWRLPVEYFFNRRLHVHFGRQEDTMPDDEPFSLDNLQNYHLKSALLQARIDNILSNEKQSPTSVETSVKQRYLGQGKLPNGTFGDIAFEQAKAIIDPLIEHIEPLISSPESPAQIQLTFQPFHQDQESTVTLTGHLKSLYHAGVVHYRVGGIRPVDVLMAWIDHLIANSLGLKKATHLIGYNNKEGVQEMCFPSLTKTQAYPFLADLVDLYFHGLEAPLCYFPKTCFAAIQSGVKSVKKTGTLIFG